MYTSYMFMRTVKGAPYTVLTRATFSCSICFADNCESVSNPDQIDGDSDEVGDDCGE